MRQDGGDPPEGVIEMVRVVSVAYSSSWLGGGLLLAAAPESPWTKTMPVSASWLGSSCSTCFAVRPSSQPWSTPLSCAPVTSGDNSWTISPRDTGWTWTPCKLCCASTRRQTGLGSGWTHWDPAGTFLVLSTLWALWSPQLVSLKLLLFVFCMMVIQQMPQFPKWNQFLTSRYEKWIKYSHNSRWTISLGIKLHA